MLSTLVHGYTNNAIKYRPEVRKFCLRMMFYSRAAYNQLRHFFNNHLPARRTIQRWLNCIDGSPGITTLSSDALAEKVREYKLENKQLHLCLIHDEISIGKHISWKSVNNSFDGFSTMTNQNTNNDEKEIPVAKDALVYMVVGPDFRIAVAYFLLDGLQAIDRAALSKEVIRRIEVTGAIVTSFTGDALPSNIASFKLLGCDFKANKPFFSSPSHPERHIYLIFDPPHMLKLIRKDFATHKLFYKNEPLRWDLLEKLAAKQDSNNFSLGNKLTLRRHINWKLSPMTVKYATGSISNSVADVLEQLCEDSYEDFVGCGPTVKLLRIGNNVFDVLNYGDGKKTNGQFKKPICASNMPAFLDLFEQYRELIDGMSVEIGDIKKPLKSYLRGTSKFVGFLGFLQNITNVIGIFDDFIKNGSLDVFYTFQFSQDHLETFFSLIRGSLGANTNPNAEQFKAAYKKLLLCLPHMSSRNTNCNYFDVSDILTVSSTQKPTTSSHINIMSANVIEINTDYDILISTEMEPYEKHMCAYLASLIESKVILEINAQPVISCFDCLPVFGENHKIYNKFIEKKNISGHPMVQPCSSTYDIIVACNSILNILQANVHVEYNIMSKTIFSNLHIDVLYDSSQFDSHSHHASSTHLTHKEIFIFHIIQEYLNMKSTNIGKRITDEEWADSMKRRKAKRIRILDGR